MPESSIQELMTFQMVQNIKNVHLIEEASPDIHILTSGLINWEDCEVRDNISSIDNQFKTYCNIKCFFINNSNIKPSCLAKDELHLNRAGNKIFAKKIHMLCKWMESLLIVASSTSPVYVENINVTLKGL